MRTLRTHPLALAAALVLAAPAAFAQTPAVEAPKHKCEAAPKMPGARMMEEPNVRRNFERDVKKYKDCITAYIDERNATIKANEAAANAAVAEFNASMKAIQDAQAGR